MSALNMLVRSEAKMVVRDTAGLVVPIALPLLILVMSAAAAGDEIVDGGRSALEVYVLPLVFAMVIAMVAIINMPSFLTTYRKTGILRRLSVTPVSPGLVLAAQVIVNLALALIGIAVASLIAALAYGAGAPASWPAALGVMALAIFAMYALGLVIASLAPTPNSAIAAGLIVFFALGALGGMFGGTDALPEALNRLGELLPFGATAEALGAAWSGQTVEAKHLIALAVCGLTGTTVAALTFRWDR